MHKNKTATFALWGSFQFPRYLDYSWGFIIRAKPQFSSLVWPLLYFNPEKSYFSFQTQTNLFWCSNFSSHRKSILDWNWLYMVNSQHNAYLTKLLGGEFRLPNKHSGTKNKIVDPNCCLRHDYNPLYIITFDSED